MSKKQLQYSTAIHMFELAMQDFKYKSEYVASHQFDVTKNYLWLNVTFATALFALFFHCDLKQTSVFIIIMFVLSGALITLSIILGIMCLSSIFFSKVIAPFHEYHQYSKECINYAISYNNANELIIDQLENITLSIKELSKSIQQKKIFLRSLCLIGMFTAFLLSLLTFQIFVI